MARSDQKIRRGSFRSRQFRWSDRAKKSVGDLGAPPTKGGDRRVPARVLLRPWSDCWLRQGNVTTGGAMSTMIKGLEGLARVDLRCPVMSTRKIRFLCGGLLPFGTLPDVSGA